jgi:hypothetical protein
MIAMATQMSRMMNPCPPRLPADDTIAVAATPRATEPSAVMVVATFRAPTGEGRAGGGPSWYPGGSTGPG